MKLVELAEECISHNICDECPYYEDWLSNKGPCYKACVKYKCLVVNAISYYDINHDKEDY